jgi:amino acid adenylation domain-containing protein
VARGYLNRPELTAEKFIPDPFSADPAARLYKTGDLARYLADGSIEYLGRIDFQVKIRGLRVELGEIEARLGQIEAIDKCVVVVREDRPGDQRLVAYYVLRSDFTPAVSDWRAQLSTRLPDYMVPQFFVQLDAIPLSANGKVDRRTLPEPEAGNVLERQDYVAPRTPVEHEIAAIWQEVLQLESVGIHDDFFELGGHSLLATQVISRVRRLFDVQVPLRRLFEAPTVEGLAAAVKEICAHPAGATPPQLPPVVPVARDAALPLSFAQERLWFLQQLEPQSTAYSMPTLFRWRGRLDLRCLQMAIDALAQRHEALRTTFAFAGDRPEQIIAGEAHLAIHREDLRHLDEEQREAKALQLAGGLFRQPFDLAAGPLFRMAVYQLAEDDHILLANMHHIISDHWSFGIMSREITQLYGAYAGGREAPLDALPVQYADFACCQRNWLQGEVLAFHLGYWKEKLGGDLTVLDLPADRPRPPVQTHNGAECSLELNAELVDNLGQVGRKAGASLFMVLLAAFKLLLHRLSGQTDIVVGTPVSGRNRLELEGLVGFFINTLVLRTDLSDDPTFEALLERVRETALGAYAHQEMPFEKLVEALSPRRDLSRTPLFQVFFNHIRVDDQAAQPTDLTLQTVGAIAPEAKFDLTLYVQEQRDRIRLSAVYNADLFDAERMAAMLAQYQYLLTQAAEQPDLKIGAYSLVRDEDRAVLPDLSQTLQEEWPGPVTERLAHWARLAGRSIALEDAWAVFSYTDLEQMSNRLAWRLAGSGVVPGDVVAVYGHRSAGLVLALLGIMKVGAAFLILDPDYPPGRLKHMLEGADPRGLIELAAAGSAAALIDGRPLACRVTLPRDKQGQQALLAGDDGAPLGVAPGPDERAYIIFTSGTSGHPKGIVGTHRPLSHFLRWHCERFGFTAADRFSMLSGLSHDPLLRDIFTPLWAGARLCIPDPELALQPEALNGWMRRRRLTVAHLTPALSHVLAEGAPVQPTALRYLFFGGDTLDRRTVEKAAALAPGACCVNFYGTTETPQAMSHEVIEPGSRPALPETIPLGRGIEGVQLMVSNASGKPAGVGELGEIVVRTPYLCAGYLNDEVLTAEKFSVNPLGTSNRDRLYRTGDLGRYLPDGRVVFCGRRDSQVSIRGFRVELREIEAVLATCPGVRDCAVLVKNREPGDRYLAAFVVSNGGCALDAAVLKQYLGQCLPDFMIPAAMVPLGVLPLTPHGKIDRRHLDAMPIETGAASPDEWPLSETELRLAAIWKEVLGVDAVGVHDNFFDIGGHSLLSIQVIARLEKETGIRINPREFTYQSLGQVAAVLEERMASMKTAMPSGRQKKISNRLKHKIHRLFQRR